VLFIFCLSAAAVTNSVDEALVKSRIEVEHAAAELNSVRDKIAEERAPLASRLADLQQQVREKRIEAAQLNSSENDQEAAQRRLKADIQQLEEQLHFAHNALMEYRRDMGGRVSPALLQSQSKTLMQIDKMHNSSSRKLAELAELLTDTALKMCTGGLHPRRFSGMALDSAGMERQGQFLFLGPLGYFAADSIDDGAGIVIDDHSHLLLRYSNASSKSDREALRRLIGGGRARVVLDVSGGAALAAAEASGSLSEHIRKGGVVMIPLLLLGFAALVIVLLKLLEMRKLRAAGPESIELVVQTLKHDGVEAARNISAGLPPLTAGLLNTALDYRDVPREHAEEILHEHILAMLPRLERYLGALAVMGGVAPLLGLLGTVTGMMHTFNLISIFGAGNARLLSGGISEALITTKFGLAIAIPILLIHAFMARRVKTTVAGLENSAAQFIREMQKGSGGDESAN
jgi:biopolymer transport protein ExbB